MCVMGEIKEKNTEMEAHFNEHVTFALQSCYQRIIDYNIFPSSTDKPLKTVRLQQSSHECSYDYGPICEIPTCACLSWL